ncbi:MAG: hypothetical protein Kow0092_08580 [Deferrisomatales bacterium]
MPHGSRGKGAGGRGAGALFQPPAGEIAPPAPTRARAAEAVHFGAPAPARSREDAIRSWPDRRSKGGGRRSAGVIRIAHACVTEEVNGPGRRFTVWVQGCSLGCPGCFNPALRPVAGGRSVSPAELARQALEAEPLDGVSLSGGEPFDQAGPLAAFLDRWRAAARGGSLTALAFTGYPVETLRKGSAARRALLERLDLLVDGPYRPELAAPLPLRGSANQRLVALTPAGEALRAAVEAAGPPGFQVIVADDGEVWFTGFPPRELVEATRRRISGPERAPGDASLRPPHP